MFLVLTVSLKISIITLSQYVNELMALKALVENIGVEPMTSCVQGRRSSQLS